MLNSFYDDQVLIREHLAENEKTKQMLQASFLTEGGLSRLFEDFPIDKMSMELQHLFHRLPKRMILEDLTLWYRDCVKAILPIFQRKDGGMQEAIQQGLGSFLYSKLINKSVSTTDPCTTLMYQVYLTIYGLTWMGNESHLTYTIMQAFLVGGAQNIILYRGKLIQQEIPQSPADILLEDNSPLTEDNIEQLHKIFDEEYLNLVLEAENLQQTNSFVSRFQMANTSVHDYAAYNEISRLFRKIYTGNVKFIEESKSKHIAEKNEADSNTISFLKDIIGPLKPGVYFTFSFPNLHMDNLKFPRAIQHCITDFLESYYTFLQYPKIFETWFNGLSTTVFDYLFKPDLSLNTALISAGLTANNVNHYCAMMDLETEELSQVIFSAYLIKLIQHCWQMAALSKPDASYEDGVKQLFAALDHAQSFRVCMHYDVVEYRATIENEKGRMSVLNSNRMALNSIKKETKWPVATIAAEKGHVITLKDILEAAPELDKHYLLAVAAQHGQIRVISYLLANYNIDLNRPISLRNQTHTSLELSCINGHLETAQYLVKSGAVINNKMLELSAIKEQFGIYNFLIQHVTQPAMVEYEYTSPTPFEYGVAYYDTIISAKSGDTLKLAQLIKKYNIAYAIDLDGMGLLELSSQNGHLGNIRYLLSIPWDPARKNNALLLACTQGCYEIAKLLLEHGANPNIQHNGEPLVFIAARNQKLPIVTLLLQQGANQYAISENQQTLLEVAILNDHVDIDHSDSITSYLLNRGFDPNYSSEQGYTALYRATCLNNIKLVHKLITLNADVNQASKGGLRPLHAAALLHDIHAAEMSQYLLDQGALVNVTCNEQDTPMRKLIKSLYYDVQVIRGLLMNGADIKNDLFDKYPMFSSFFILCNPDIKKSYFSRIKLFESYLEHRHKIDEIRTLKIADMAEECKPTLFTGFWDLFLEVLKHSSRLTTLVISNNNLNNKQILDLIAILNEKQTLTALFVSNKSTNVPLLEHFKTHFKRKIITLQLFDGKMHLKTGMPFNTPPIDTDLLLSMDGIQKLKKLIEKVTRFGFKYDTRQYDYRPYSRLRSSIEHLLDTLNPLVSDHQNLVAWDHFRHSLKEKINDFLMSPQTLEETKVRIKARYDFLYSIQKEIEHFIKTLEAALAKTSAPLLVSYSTTKGARSMSEKMAGKMEELVPRISKLTIGG